MDKVSFEQIRQFRLHSHHLDTWYQESDAENIAGACGLQNTPPGAWETALHNRIPTMALHGARQLLEADKTLLQAWSFRGAPVVFPTAESNAFLSALVAKGDEPWIYTHGIQLALDFLDMAFDDLLSLLMRVIPGLDNTTIKSKAALDQTLAEWMAPLLPADKADLWNSPSLYGAPDKQTVGGAVVSFLLRPCSFRGLVVFGKREGISPTFTSYKGWIGEPPTISQEAEQELVRKYLHCYGPASVADFAYWLGCSPEQAERLWRTIAKETVPVSAEGRTRFILSADKDLLASPPLPKRQMHLLGGHDPYLGLQDREVILKDTARQKQVWQTVSNPGAILLEGEIVGVWKSRKKGGSLSIEATLWNDAKVPEDELRNHCEAYASFLQCTLECIDIRR